ncbi:MAG: 50S ribosomal protein L13 [Candidatus Parvarchaeota archaeon]|jgi:large subunit ribosomal protein L13|nr:50S ribosomal protein L13 [Candidatus Parvarchaeota archaeon]
MIIDGKDSALGRVASMAAKSAVKGEQVVIVNADDIVIIGDKRAILGKYLERREVGTMSKGPFFPRTVTGIVRRAVRGMLKRQIPSGREAFRRVKVFEGLPEEFKDKEKASAGKYRMDIPLHKVKIAELSQLLKHRQA